MEDRKFGALVFDFLVFEKAFPHSEIQMELVLGSVDSARYRSDLAILDSRRNEIIALIGTNRTREPRPLRLAIAQLQQCRRLIDKPFVPLYLFFPSLEGSGKRFDIFQVLPDGSTVDVQPDEFPSYDALVSFDKSGKKAARAGAVRRVIDTFKLTCVSLSLIAGALFVLDVFGALQLSVKQLTLAGIAAALLILPFAAKFKMLGIEFERRSQAPSEGEG